MTVSVPNSLVQLGLLGAFGLDQPVDAVERNAAVVADDAAAPVGVGQAGDEARAARGADRRRVRVEHAVVVGLAVAREDLGDRAGRAR